MKIRTVMTIFLTSAFKQSYLFNFNHAKIRIYPAIFQICEQATAIRVVVCQFEKFI